MRSALALIIVIGTAFVAGPALGAPTCCKVCSAGKACGDSCIARDSRCTKPPGCACDAGR